MTSQATGRRLQGLDIFRGWALLLMTFYHLAYNLNYFHYLHINMDHDRFWVYGRYLIVTMFLLAAGISLSLAYTPTIQWQKLLKRIVILGGAALLVTLSTYLQFPHTWVYFGILHFILFASLLGLLFLNRPRTAVILALIIFLGSYQGWLHSHWLFQLLQAPLHLPPRYTIDVVRPFPWFGVILLGIAMVPLGVHQKLFAFSFFRSNSTPNRLLAFLGRHSLLYYLLHQPLLFGLVSFLHAL